MINQTTLQKKIFSGLFYDRGRVDRNSPYDRFDHNFPHGTAEGFAVEFAVRVPNARVPIVR
jgi:hypothetical protein